MKAHLDEYRQAFRPPHNIRDLIPVLGTLFLLAAIPLTVYVANQARELGGQAARNQKAGQTQHKPSFAPSNKEESVPDEIIVKFKDSVNEDARVNTAASQSVEEKQEKRIEKIGARVYKVDQNRKDQALEALKNNPNVEYAEPNYIVHALDTRPNDTYYYQQWNLSKIGMPKAWDLQRGFGFNSPPTTKIAIVDSGIDYNHEDINSSQIIASYDFIENDTDASDSSGHGTHVAGIISASTNNRKGVSGVTWNRSFLIAKFIGSNGSGNIGKGAAAIIWAADNGAQVINNSWGGYSYSATLQSAVNYAVGRGAVVIAAAGNTGDDKPRYPAAYDNVIAVGGTNESDALASFSSYGFSDLVAPAINIFSAVRENTPTTQNSTCKNSLINGKYCSLHGTSFSSAHVSGVAALLWAHGAIDRNEVERALLDGAKDLGDPGIDEKYGVGRVDAYNSLVKLASLGVDTDGDGFSDVKERYMGTSFISKCGVNAWPADFDNDGSITITDVLALKPLFGTSSGGAGYNKRYDLNADGRIDITDVLALKPHFGATCTP